MDINNFNNSRWRIVISNIPSVNKVEDLSIYDEYVKSCVIPDFNVVETIMPYMGSIRRDPITKPNQDLTQLQIEFFANESLSNYTNLFEFQQQLKYGQNVDSEFLHKNVIKRINIEILDNQNRHIKTIYFTNALLLSLSSLSLLFGVDDNTTFTGNFSYEEMKIEDGRDV